MTCVGWRKWRNSFHISHLSRKNNDIIKKMENASKKIFRHYESTFSSSAIVNTCRQKRSEVFWLFCYDIFYSNRKIYNIFRNYRNTFINIVILLSLHLFLVSVVQLFYLIRNIPCIFWKIYKTDEWQLWMNHVNLAILWWFQFPSLNTGWNFFL